MIPWVFVLALSFPDHSWFGIRDGKLDRRPGLHSVVFWSYIELSFLNLVLVIFEQI
jgi:hypothetical protein